MSLPTQEEIQLIQKFRERVGDILTPKQLENDLFLVRWLRARELDLEKAESMIRNSMKWREENKVDFVLDQKVDDYFLVNYPFDVNWKDREGRALVIVPFGKWDILKAVDDGRVGELQTYFNYFFESLMRAVGSSEGPNPSHPHSQCVFIADWEGYSLKQFTSIKAAQSILKLVATYEAHYPEVLFRSYCINCSSAFQMLFALIKKMLPERTVSKIQLCSSNREEWEDQVKKLVDLEMIQKNISNPMCNL